MIYDAAFNKIWMFLFLKIYFAVRFSSISIPALHRSYIIYATAICVETWRLDHYIPWDLMARRKVWHAERAKTKKKKIYKKKKKNAIAI